MALKVKAVERLLKFDKESAGKYRYVMKADLYTSLTQAKVIKEAALRSGVSQGVMKACWDAAGEVIKAWATEGHSVALPGLGSMRFGLRSKAVENVNDVKAGLITSRRIIFTPSVDLKDELANTAIQITCIDRNGNEVKRVTSTSGDVEDPENDGGDDNGGGDNGGGSSQNSGSNSGSNSGNSGSGSVTQSVSAPTFSGATQFEESTQVSMNGPAGAEIHYTTDGTQPTAQSALYTEPITLTETTTVKAIAIKDGKSSSVTSRTYTKGGNAGGGEGSGDME